MQGKRRHRIMWIGGGIVLLALCFRRPGFGLGIGIGLLTPLGCWLVLSTLARLLPA